MSRPLRSIMVEPRWLNTKPAPAAITRPMPAITAKAANRLPRRPTFGILKRGLKRPRKRPRLRRIAIEIPPHPQSLVFAAEYAWGGLKNRKLHNRLRSFRRAKKKGPATRPALDDARDFFSRD